MRGRPNLHTSTTPPAEITVRMDKPVHAELLDIARECGLSAPQYVRSLVYAHIKRLREAQEPSS